MVRVIFIRSDTLQKLKNILIMNRVKFSRPASPKSFTNVLDDIFNTSLSDIMGSDFSMNKPSVNIIENKDDYTIEVAAPGLKKEDFKIKVDKDQLIIQAHVEKEDEEASNKKSYRRREFNFSSFKRSFHLSDKIDSDKISADYNAGILSLKIEKREEAKEKAPRTIEIK